MHDQPLISVGVCVYNGEGFIKESLLSVLNQTHSNLEILLYDDGSSDETAAIARSVGSPLLKIFSGDVNRGVGYAREFLAKKFSGDYMIWQDHDDVMLPCRLSSLLETIQKVKADICIDHYQPIDHSGNPCGSVLEPIIPEHDPFYTSLFEKNTMLPHALITRDCFINIRYDTSLMGSEDYDFWLKCSAGGFSFSEVRRVGLLYRILGTSLSSNHGFNLIQTKKVLEKYSCSDIERLYLSRGYDEGYVNKALCRIQIFTGNLNVALLMAQLDWGEEHNLERLFYLGTLLTRLGRHSEGAQVLMKHLESDPRSPATLNNLGVLLFESDSEAAGKNFRSAISAFPGYSDALYNLSESTPKRLTPTYIEKGRVR